MSYATLSKDPHLVEKAVKSMPAFKEVTLGFSSGMTCLVSYRRYLRWI